LGTRGGGFTKTWGGGRRRRAQDVRCISRRGPFVGAVHVERRVAPRLLTGLCYAAMMSLSIGLNLVPVFIIARKLDLRGV